MPAKKTVSKAAAVSASGDAGTSQSSSSASTSKTAGTKRTRAMPQRAAKKSLIDKLVAAENGDVVVVAQANNAAQEAGIKKKERVKKKTMAEQYIEGLEKACDTFVSSLVNGKVPTAEASKTPKKSASLPAFALPHTTIMLDRLLKVDGFVDALRKYNLDQYLKLVRDVQNESKNELAKEKLASKDREALNERSLFVFGALADFLASQSPAEVGMEAANALRKELLESGVIEIVLVCLAQYAQQGMRVGSLRPEDGSLAQCPPADVLRKFFSALESKSRNYFGNVTIDRGLARVEQFYSVKAIKNNAPNVEKNLMAPTNFWEKGTGYGTGAMQSIWNAQETAAQLRSNEQFVSALFDVLVAFIIPDLEHQLSDADAELASVFDDTRLVHIFYRSCLQKTLQSYLFNDSVMDISNRIGIYSSLLRFVTALCSIPEDVCRLAPSTASGSNVSDLMIEILNGTDSSSVRELLEKLTKTLDNYLGKINQAAMPKTPAKAKKAPAPRASSRVTRSMTNTSKAIKAKPPSEDVASSSGETMLTHVLEIAKKALEAVKKRTPEKETAAKTSATVDKHAPKASSATPAVAEKTRTEIYVDALAPYQFDSVLFFEADGKTNRFPFYYTNQLDSIGSASNLAKRTRRLAQELVTLQTALPLTLGSSVFIRASEERLDAMKVLITGPASTPYSNGCFEFDVYFPKNYPECPMHVNMITTGHGSVRFNPNLYNDGKVCLSLLNTWSGRPEERWSSTSSLLQVLVSIQSLIFVEDPFFNEPGFERYRGQPFGDKESRRYNTNIQAECVRWAMLEQLRNPPKAFENVIRRHFWLKRDEIHEQVTEWIADLERYISVMPTNVDTNAANLFPGRLAALKKNFEDLKAEMLKMKAPEGLEGSVSKHFGPDDDVIVIDDQQPGPSGVQQRGKKRVSKGPSTPKAKAKKVAC